jgi:hypothetical protein
VGVVAVVGPGVVVGVVMVGMVTVAGGVIVVVGAVVGVVVDVPGVVVVVGGWVVGVVGVVWVCVPWAAVEGPGGAGLSVRVTAQASRPPLSARRTTIAAITAG